MGLLLGDHVLGSLGTPQRFSLIDSPLLSSPVAPPPKLLSEVIRMEICRYILNSFTFLCFHHLTGGERPPLWVVNPQFRLQISGPAWRIFTNPPGLEPASVSVCLLLSVCSHSTAGGEFQGGAAEASGCPGRHLEGEEGLYPPEPDCASLHDSEGLFHSEEQQQLPAASDTTNKKFPQSCFRMLGNRL